MPMEGSHFVCLSVILIGSFLDMGRNYCPRVVLEECIFEISSDEPDYSDKNRWS